jgi:hypothetical protein
MARDPDPSDISEVLHLWSDLFEDNLKLALSTENDAPEERRVALERLFEAHRRSLAERDEAWLRIVRRLEAGSRGR